MLKPWVIISYFILVISFVLCGWGASFSRPLLHIYFFSIGQGDAILIRSPEGKNVLIDGGPDQLVLEKIGSVLPLWSRSIDMLVITNSDDDHMVGALEVLQRYPVSMIVDNGRFGVVPQEQYWLFFAAEHRIPRFLPQQIDVLQLDSATSLKFFVSEKATKNNNNYSVVTRLGYKDFDAVFTGDIEKEIEQELIDSPFLSPGELLKVAHHGSKTSSTQAFLKRYNPMVGVISCGKDNQYGHPHQETLDSFKENQMQLFRTDEDGDVEVVSDGTNFWINTLKI
ncbi:MAG: MBL fold metallo-hydrolase [bacterium]